MSNDGPQDDAPRFGAYRRTVRIRGSADGATAEMEDDVHHFRVRLWSEDGVLADIAGEAIRTPYTVCPGAVTELKALIGKTLETVRKLPSDERFQQCMHLHDIAALAAAHAGSAGFARDYRIEVDHDAPRPHAQLWRDSEALLAWSIDTARIVGSRYDDTLLRELHTRFADHGADEIEAALVLRRASLISFVRKYDLDAFDDARGVSPTSPSNCYAKQNGRRGEARRVRGSSRDFHGDDRWPLGESEEVRVADPAR